MSQYVLMVDEQNMIYLKTVLPGIQFLKIEGMKITGLDNHQVLVTPVQPQPTEQNAEPEILL